MQQWKTTSVEVAVFGVADPEAIAGQVEEFCREHLGSEVDHAIFYGASAGCTSGLVLNDGRGVVVKAYQARWRTDFLAAVRRAQDHLHRSGFPCPLPLAGPHHTGPALATADELIPDPGMRAFGSAGEMGISAAGLALQIELCRALKVPRLAPHPLHAAADSLYPDPHNPLFDFSLGQEDTGWIDDLAAAAQAVRDGDSSPRIVAHTDWSARNVRIGATGVVVAYDWDSLSLVTEPVAVGQAAATWRSTGEGSDPLAPDVQEVRSYVAAYEAAAHRSFSPGQVRVAVAAALWVLAYTARCEHALEAVTGRRVERARACLRAGGRSYMIQIDA
jgi:hypothetical protein